MNGLNSSIVLNKKQKKIPDPKRGGKDQGFHFNKRTNNTVLQRREVTQRLYSTKSWTQDQVLFQFIFE